jgi:hypothetical protein
VTIVFFVLSGLALTIPVGIEYNFYRSSQIPFKDSWLQRQKPCGELEALCEDFLMANKPS